MSTRAQSASAAWQNQIVRYADAAPSSLIANPANFRTHPTNQQAALDGALSEVGWISPVIVNETTGHTIDGHARIELAIRRGEPTVPVAYVRLTEAAERLALATFDPIGSLAGQDDALLTALLADLSVSDAGLSEILSDLEQRSGPPTDPNAEWQGMPEFEQDDRLGGSAFQLVVHFRNLADKQAFSKLLGQALTDKTKYVWYPEELPADRLACRWTDESEVSSLRSI
jgi:hypothetical protein